MPKQALPTPTRESTAFGHRITRLRERRGLSAYVLAGQAKINLQYLRRIERGVVLNPSWFTVCRIADALGVGLEEFR